MLKNYESNRIHPTTSFRTSKKKKKTVSKMALFSGHAFLVTNKIIEQINQSPLIVFFFFNYPASMDSHSHVSGKFFRTLMVDGPAPSCIIDGNEAMLSVMSWSSITFDLK